MFQLKKIHDPLLGRKRYRVWLRQAQFDLEAAEISLQNDFPEWTTYQSEQAVEKSLKAVIVHSGFVPPKIHKLSVLMSYCNNLNDDFRNTKFEYRLVDTFTFISRYPFLLPGRDTPPHQQIDKKSASAVLDQATSFVSNIKSILEGETWSGKELYKGKSVEERPAVNIEARLDYIVGCLLDVFKPEKIILFGSYARGEKLNGNGTIDLLIIADTKLDFVSRIKQARELTSGGTPSIEPLVYTPEEYRFMTEEEGEGFLEQAVQEGRVLYEKKQK